MTEIGVQLPEIGVQLRPKPVFNFARNRCSTSSENPRCRAEPAAGALPGRDAPPRDHRDRLAGTTAYALEATVVLDIIHVAAATRRAVLVVGSSKGL